MQVLNAPSREELDYAHYKGFWFAIGICIQLAMVVCLWLLAIPFKAKSEKLGITYDFTFLDPIFVLFDALTTATALHLLAYRTY
jgi:hypothetical protein